MADARLTEALGKSGYIERSIGGNGFKAGWLAAMAAMGPTPSPPVAASPATPYKHVEPTCEDAALLWAEIHHLRAAVQGPEGFASWQEAATAERVRRVKAERAAQPQPQPAQPLTEPQVVALLCELNGAIYESASPTDMFATIVRAVERLHGITAPSTPTPPEVAP
jgi:hypothetical protein